MSEQVKELTLCRDCQYWKQDDIFGVMGDCWGECSLLMSKENGFMVVVYAREDGIMYTWNTFGCPAGRAKPAGPFRAIQCRNAKPPRLLFEHDFFQTQTSLPQAEQLAEWLNELWAEKGKSDV